MTLALLAISMIWWPTNFDFHLSPLALYVTVS